MLNLIYLIDKIVKLANLVNLVKSINLTKLQFLNIIQAYGLSQIKYLKRIGMERVREALEDQSRGKNGEAVAFKHWLLPPEQNHAKITGFRACQRAQ